MRRRLAILIATIAVIAATAVGVAAWQGIFGLSPRATAIERGATARQIINDLAGRGAPATGRLTASGLIEAHQVVVAAEVGGVIVDLPVHEGDVVAEGQLLAQLDTELIDAQLAQAEAAVAAAQAALDLAQAGPRDVDVRQAEMAVRVAEAAREGARQAWEDAKALRDNPQDLDVQITRARGEVATAARQVAAAEARARAADEEHALWGRTLEWLRSGIDVVVDTPIGTRYLNVEPGADKIQAANLQWNLSGQQAWQAWQAVEQAKAALLAAQARLRNLEAKRNDLIELRMEADRAEAALRVAEAQVEQAQAALARVREGATAEQIAVAAGRLQQAIAARDRIAVQRAKFTVSAPRAGVVTARPANRGEVAIPGAALVKIADLDQVTLTVYVPEDQVGRIRLGDPVAVSVDSFPGRVFSGRVSYIADRAEFTPKNVQTAEDRINMVFAVKIDLANPDHVLKPGMPADADFGAQQ